MKTSPRQTSLFTEEKLTSSQEVSLASRTAKQGNDLERKMTATSGQICVEQYGKFSRHTLWAKMLLASLVGMEGWYSMKCRLTWKLKGTKYNRYYFQLVPSTLPTEEIGFGLLPTVKTWDAKKESPNMGKETIMKNGRIVNVRKDGTEFGALLMDAAKYNLLPTPTSVQRDHPERVQKLIATGATTMQSRKAGDNRPNSILDGVMFYGMLPTPAADDNPSKNTGKRNQDGLQKRAFQTTGKTSQLNPQFVAEMMGFPTDWTELPFLNGETNLSKPTGMQ